MKSRVFTITSLLALLVAMVASSTAFAQSSPGQEVYNPGGEVLNVVQGGGSDNTKGDNAKGGNEDVAAENGSSPSAAPVAVSSGELPFTGFQAGLVAFAGLALLGTGVAMRRVARTNDA